MSVLYFCDVCGKEMPADENGRVVRTLGDLKIEIMHAHKSVWNGGNVCHACILNVVKEGTEPKNSASVHHADNGSK